jgi:hypothetical protein
MLYLEAKMENEEKKREVQQSRDTGHLKGQKREKHTTERLPDYFPPSLLIYNINYRDSRVQ